MAIAFDVTSVEPDRDPLVEVAVAGALEARGLRNLVACDADGALLVDALPLNGLVMALHLAYTRHRPLRLRPDDVWLCIAQGLARHVDEHAEALRSRLVRHQGQLAIEVRRDELLVDPSSVREWAIVVDGLAERVREHLGGRADLFVAGFSTTTMASRAASQITLLGAVQKYFTYSVASLCGIPRVVLDGTPDDWADVRRRARVLGEFDLGWWAEALDPVLAKLAETAAGSVDRRWWERIYKVHHASGGEAISGWVNALFPYLHESGDTRNAWFARGDEANELELPKLGHYPTGMASAPFTWRVGPGGDERAMRLVAGFVGVARSEAEGVAPAIGWAVLPSTPPRRFDALTSPFEPGVTTLSSRAGTTMTSLEGLAEQIALDGLQRVNLSLWWCKALTSLEGLAGVAAVEDVNILGCDALERLDGLAAAPRLRSLSVAQCARLRDLSPLAGLPAVEDLRITNNPNVTDYSPVAALRSLKQLHLYGDSVPAFARGSFTDPAAIVSVQQKLRQR